MSLSKSQISYISLFILVVVIFFSALNFYQTKSQQEAMASLPDASKIKIPLANIIEYTDAGKNAQQEAVIKYTYVSEQVVPPQQYRGLKEDITLRTPTSQVFVKDIKSLNAKENKVTYVGKFYSGPTFSNQKDGQWRTLEYATTTKSAFLLQTKPTILTQVKGLLGQPVFATTYYAGSGDGYVYHGYAQYYNVGPMDWNTVHDATTGLGAWTGSSPLPVQSTYYYDSPADEDVLQIWRMFFPFNTSGIPANAGIISASFKFLAQNINDGANDAYGFLRVVQTNQTSSTALSTSDYDNCGAVANPDAGAADLDITGISTVAYTSITLNTTGLSWIKKNGQTPNCGTATGYTCLGLREGHDATDNAINVTNQVFRSEYVNIYNSEQSGTANDPYLEVTYSVPAVKINGGTMKVKGGTVKINGN